MKTLGVGWFLLIILAILQYNLKKERLFTQYIPKNGIRLDEKWDKCQISEQESKNLRPISEWDPLRNSLKRLEMKP